MSRKEMEDENSEGLLNHINKLKTIQDKTASRDQFAAQRINFYNLIGHLFEINSNRVISADRELGSSRHRLNSQESRQINDFPNFPATFPVSLKRLQRAVRGGSMDEEDLSDLDSDLCDETHEGMGAQEQNERLRQMTLPVFFKNDLTHEQNPSIPQRPQNAEQDEPDVEESNLPSSVRSSVMMQEDRPMMGLLPRYFDEIIMVDFELKLKFSQARRVLSGMQGLNHDFIYQLPERQVDIQWIKKKVEENGDFRKCLICLMDYEHLEKVRTLPCLHFFHSECIDFWLQRSKKCPLCKNNCDQIEQKYNF